MAIAEQRALGAGAADALIDIRSADNRPVNPDRRTAAAGVPLLVDLDSCLIRTDLLFETALAYVGAHPLRIFRVLGWLFSGRAHLKKKLAEVAILDLSLIPINQTIAAYARQGKREGRDIYLMTGSDEFIARKIATRFEFLDGVVASDGRNNFKGRRKADVARARFPSGFDYIGDCHDDLHVWRHAQTVIAVEPSASLLRSIRELNKPTKIVKRAPVWPSLMRAARLHQWAKNTLIFLPAILSGQILHAPVAVSCGLTFLALGLVAFGTYLINDLSDLSHDRAHWSKRHRPLASGELPIKVGVIAAPVAIVSGLALAAAVGLPVVLALVAYLAVTLAYSFRLKRFPIVDTFTLAGLFTMRLVLGIAASGVVASPWLLVFSMFLVHVAVACQTLYRDPARRRNGTSLGGTRLRRDGQLSGSFGRSIDGHRLCSHLGDVSDLRRLQQRLLRQSSLALGIPRRGVPLGDARVAHRRARRTR